MSKLLLTKARPYAQAAFDFAVEHQAIEKWELMLSYIKKVFQSKLIIRLFSYFSYIDSKQLSDLLILICGHHLDGFGQNFVHIIVKYDKVYLIEIIFREFVRLRRMQDMIMDMEIVSVIPLHNNQLSKIVHIFKKKFHCTIHISCKHDPFILGGVIIRTENMVIDASIRGRIECLKKKILYV